MDLFGWLVHLGSLAIVLCFLVSLRGERHSPNKLRFLRVPDINSQAKGLHELSKRFKIQVALWDTGNYEWISSYMFFQSVHVNEGLYGSNTHCIVQLKQVALTCIPTDNILGPRICS